MFRSFRSQNRVDKASTKQKKSKAVRKDLKKLLKLERSIEEENLLASRILTSPIVTLMVGQECRLFAAHEKVLCQSPFFERIFQDVQYLGARNKRISLPQEQPEIFSAILEYLYTGDYYPRLLQNKHRNSAAARSPVPPDHLLRDTVIYCAAERFGLDELKRLALRKQGLQSGVDVATILRSAHFAYDNTPDTDSRLRAHYVNLIIRCRKTFKKSGTMQMEMERGGRLFFELFVAMCNDLDDLAAMTNTQSPRTI